MAELVKRDEDFTVYEYDNGYMLQCAGRDDNDDWVTSKVVYNSVDQLFVGIQELLQIPKN